MVWIDGGEGGGGEEGGEEGREGGEEGREGGVFGEGNLQVLLNVILK